MTTQGSVRIIAGQFKKKNLLYSTMIVGLRPTLTRVRITLFDWLHSEIKGARCWDMFAGTGVLGMEALSRGAKHVTFTECQYRLLTAIRQFGEKLQVHNADYFHCDLSAYSIEYPYEACDIFFIDPPFEAFDKLFSSAYKLIQKYASSHALIYIEQSVDSLPTILRDYPFECVKQSRAGTVVYGLYRLTGKAK